MPQVVEQVACLFSQSRFHAWGWRPRQSHQPKVYSNACRTVFKRLNNLDLPILHKLNLMRIRQGQNHEGHCWISCFRMARNCSVVLMASGKRRLSHRALNQWVRPPGNVLSTPGDMGNGLASLGIEVVESARGVPGVLVAGFSPDSRADDAGLRKNDVIVSFGSDADHEDCRRGKLSVSASSGANCFGSSFTWRPIDCFADSTLWSLGCGSSADAPGNLTSPLEC